MKNIAIILARSGSKGLPDKNILPLAGKPLIAYSIEAALESGCFDKVMVSTDSEKYAQIAKEYGAEVPFLRSDINSSDTASSWESVAEVLAEYEKRGEHFDMFTLLQPTSPLRTAADIKGAYHQYQKRRAGAVVSVCEAEHSPRWCKQLPENLSMDGFLTPQDVGPRQALGTFYRLNGSIYMVNCDHFKENINNIYHDGCYAYVMPQERSFDIDTMLDFVIAETVMKHFQ
ncbi:MAG: acylneuraminate cytidylyltransferase family protein [Clostridia bacterium]|nr:acylneuraminate cytidylyltransferase family protein [Clostridia bacterium]